MKWKGHAKEATMTVRQRWLDRETVVDAVVIILVGACIVVGVPALVVGVYLLLPGLVVMVGAWGAHQVWDAIPALGYWYSVLVVAALRVLAWLAGQFLRWIIVSAVGGSE